MNSTSNSVRHASREDEYKEYTDNIINLMKELNPELRDETILAEYEPLTLNNNTLYILPFVNVDIDVQDNNNVERNVDRIHIHIPYLLKLKYICAYMKTAIIYTYFIDREQAHSIIQIDECRLASNIDDTQNFFLQSLTRPLHVGELFLGNILFNLNRVGIDWGPSCYEDINTTVKFCVISNNFINQIPLNYENSQTPIPNLNFWYDLGSSLNRITNSEASNEVNDDNDNVNENEDDDDEINNNEINNVRRNLISDFNAVAEDSETIEHGVVEPTNIRIGECPVCYDEREIGNYYNCSHGICCDCFNLWSQENYTTCPMCRSNVINTIQNHENVDENNYFIGRFVDEIILYPYVPTIPESHVPSGSMNMSGRSFLR